MSKVKIISYEEAAELINDNDTVALAGFVQSSLPEGLCQAAENRFLKTAHPKRVLPV